MIASGNYVRGDKLAFRWLEPDDEQLIFDCMRDWPSDRYGRTTLQRARQHVANGINENDEALEQVPLTPAADFHANFVITQAGTDIGFTYLRAWGQKLHVKVLSFLPAERGQGHFRETYWLFRYVGFEAWDADVMTFAAFRDNQTLAAYRERFPNRTTRANNSGRYPSQTGRATVVSEYNADQHFADQGRYQRRDGGVIEISLAE